MRVRIRTGNSKEKWLVSLINPKRRQPRIRNAPKYANSTVHWTTALWMASSKLMHGSCWAMLHLVNCLCPKYEFIIMFMIQWLTNTASNIWCFICTEHTHSTHKLYSKSRHASGILLHWYGSAWAESGPDDNIYSREWRTQHFSFSLFVWQRSR